MRSLKNQLENRQLRFDGVSEIKPDELARFILLGVPASKLRVSESTEEVEAFNIQVPEEDRIGTVHEDPVVLDMDWQLPEPYKSLNLRRHFGEVFAEQMPELSYPFPEFNEAIDRCLAELKEVENRGMVEFMRTVIYIMDELKRNDIVWGVGRGSSCASYLLFLIGLHVVDCVMMDVPMTEFFHD